MPMVVHDIIISFANGVKKILGDDLKKIILYGSYARGDYSENSDIDIMVLTTLTDSEISLTIGLEHCRFMIMSRGKEWF